MGPAFATGDLRRTAVAALTGRAIRTVPTEWNESVRSVGADGPQARYSWFQACQRLAYSPPRATSSSWLPSSTILPSMTTATRSASAAV